MRSVGARVCSTDSVHKDQFFFKKKVERKKSSSLSYQLCTHSLRSLRVRMLFEYYSAQYRDYTPCKSAAQPPGARDAVAAAPSSCAPPPLRLTTSASRCSPVHAKGTCHAKAGESESSGCKQWHGASWALPWEAYCGLRCDKVIRTRWCLLPREHSRLASQSSNASARRCGDTAARPARERSLEQKEQPE